jgi:hypothetical protein
MRKGQKVQWNWGNGKGEGKIIDVFHERVERKIKGEDIVRNGSKDDPAYLIEQEDGDHVLKLQSELDKAD